MNKLYQSIYSHVTQSWVAVSELTKSRGKRSGSRVLAAAITTLAALGSSSVAQAQIVLDSGTGTVSTSAIAVNPSDVAVGDGTFADGQGTGAALAVGYSSTANGIGTIAIGRGATAVGGVKSKSCCKFTLSNPSQLTN
jgi:hypothetical protein